MPEIFLSTSARMPTALLPKHTLEPRTHSAHHPEKTSSSDINNNNLLNSYTQKEYHK